MKKILQSSVFSWIALILVIILLCLTFRMRTAWWAFIDIFFAFMMVFLHLMSVYLGRKLSGIGKQLDVVSFIMGVLMVISFIVEWILFNYA